MCSFVQHISLPALPMPKQKRSNADVSTSDSSPSSEDERHGRKDKKAKKIKAKEKERKHAKRREKHRKHKKERREKDAKVLSYLNLRLDSQTYWQVLACLAVCRLAATLLNLMLPGAAAARQRARPCADSGGAGAAGTPAHHSRSGGEGESGGSSLCRAGKLVRSSLFLS